MEDAISAKSHTVPQFPLLEVDGYETRHIQAKLTPQEAKNFKRLSEGLRVTHAQLASGRHVESNADVVRYLLDFAVANGVPVRPAG